MLIVDDDPSVRAGWGCSSSRRGTRRHAAATPAEGAVALRDAACDLVLRT